MFVYGTIPAKAPEPEPSPEPEPPEKPPPPPAPKKPNVTILVDAEVEYFRKTLNIVLLWKTLWLQLALWVAILILQIILIILLMVHRHDNNLIWTAGAGLIGPLGFFMGATIFSIFTIKEPRGCLLGSAIGFQASSAIYGLLTLDLALRIFLFTSTVEVQDYQMTKNTTGNATVAMSLKAHNQTNVYDASVVVFSSLEAILSIPYILTCFFVVILFSGGACCGTLMGGKVKRFSGSPIVISTTISSNSPISSSTFTASLSSSTSRHNEAKSLPNPKNSGDDGLIKIEEHVKEGREAGFYLNERLIRICLWIEVACIPLLVIFIMIAAGFEEVIFYVDFLMPETIWYPFAISCVLFGLSVGLTFFALQNPSGCRVGSALGFQVASAVISCMLSCKLIVMLAKSDYPKMDDESIAFTTICLLATIPVIICSALISIQFCLVSCCGRYKVNQISFCDIEEVILSQYSDLNEN
ncbi:uncharacterized protein LOC110848583 isoform X2 [Folsomia candida]|uniref:Uncharacterized protein n=2 Tax=Folsomia candida TaxID=158441 RepID=A0A226EYW2_FOLCA|nr:uncharacterized protein LOC110848583 isoform X2 [Folsomia candida]XP_035706221.1 uncharacterized protein LOC110848583 isoform X2 [Folsomia candida]OXA61836.1 hypothetical protein Fcan01_03126 [Folsomia candida]